MNVDPLGLSPEGPARHRAGATGKGWQSGPDCAERARTASSDLWARRRVPTRSFTRVRRASRPASHAATGHAARTSRNRAVRCARRGGRRKRDRVVRCASRAGPVGRVPGHVAPDRTAVRPRRHGAGSRPTSPAYRRVALRHQAAIMERRRAIRFADDAAGRRIGNRRSGDLVPSAGNVSRVAGSIACTGRQQHSPATARSTRPNAHLALRAEKIRRMDNRPTRSGSDRPLVRGERPSSGGSMPWRSSAETCP